MKEIHLHIQGDDFNYEVDINQKVAGQIISYIGAEQERVRQQTLYRTCKNCEHAEWKHEMKGCTEETCSCLVFGK